MVIKNLEELYHSITAFASDGIAAYYGLRRSEVIGLKWSAIDFGGRTVTIKHKVLQNGRVTSRKWLIDFFCGKAMRIVKKNDWHIVKLREAK